MNECVFVTGGSGFIGSAVIRHLLATTSLRIVNIDKLTYAVHSEALANVQAHPRYAFYQQDIADETALSVLFAQYQPRYVMHLAAESHVDRSIDSAQPFIYSNIVGTFSLLEATRKYWLSLHTPEQRLFRFLHVSTDEVFGDLAEGVPAADERNRYAPSSPYSASKAASDHLVMAWSRTYNLPVLMTHCTNNYGPYQHSEKLIPLVIERALHGQPIPIYGNGLQIRDWLFVEDHAKALVTVLFKGHIGENYNIGANNPLSNLAVVHHICDTLALLVPRNGECYKNLITFVTDRPGHDKRYALNCNKIQQCLSWQATTPFDKGMDITIRFYINNLSKS